MNLSDAKRIFVEIARRAIIAAESTDVFVSGPINESFLIRGGLVLQGEIAEEYLDALDKLAKLVGKDGPWSKDSIDDLLARKLEIILLAEKDKNVVIKSEADAFQSELSQVPLLFHVAISVFGLDSGLDGTDFGNVRFRKGTYRPSIGIPHLTEANEDISVLYADMSALAIDSKTAEERAKAALERHLSILNALFSEGSPSNFKFTQHYVPFRTHSLIEISKNGNAPEKHLQRTRTTRPLSKSDFDRLFRIRGVARVSELLQSRKNTFADRILSALEIAGAACIHPDPYISFLLFAMSLESAIMGDQNFGEISYQLAVRASYLIANEFEARKTFVKRLKMLYGIRSRIVHSGLKDVKPSDLQEMRAVCLTCLYALTTMPPTQELASSSELDEWFLTQVLMGSAGSMTT